MGVEGLQNERRHVLRTENCTNRSFHRASCSEHVVWVTNDRTRKEMLNVKGKFFLVRALKSYKETRLESLLTSAVGFWVVSFTSWPLYPREGFMVHASVLKILTGKCLLSENARTEKIKLHLLLERWVTRKWVGLTWLRMGHSNVFPVRDFGFTWLRIGHIDVFSVREFGFTWFRIGHSYLLSVREFEFTWLRIGHNDVFFCPRFWTYVTQSDTVTCYISENLDIRVLLA